MGKRKREQKLKENEGGDLHDFRTVFVNKLPYSFTNTQLEESFSDIGPIRRCFLVKPKGSDQHRGFGFVQFAMVEDAKRAVEAKKGSVIGGRKIAVDLAKHRPSFQQRRAKTGKGDTEAQTENVEDHKTMDNTKKNICVDSEGGKRKEGIPNIGIVYPSKLITGGLITQKALKTKANKQEKLEIPSSVHPHEESRDSAEKGMPGIKHSCSPSNLELKSSAIQRVARTVIFGGLIDQKMTEAVLFEAKKAGDVESITNPLPEFELQSHGLARDGCKMGAVAVVYVSVKSACQAVARLHQKIIEGAVVWARQLGGEGSKTSKWRLIVRNLPFEASEVELRKLFSTAGFLWNITIPQGSDGRPSKGFAFVSFTCKRDAEKAIRIFNGTKVGKRPIAVDWAVSKKKYETVLTSGAANSGGEVSGSEVSDLEDNDTASEDESDNNLAGDPASSIHIRDNCVDEHRLDTNTASIKDDGNAGTEHLNILKEVDIAKKVLSNIINSHAKEDSTLISSVQNNFEEFTGAKATIPENKMISISKTTNVDFKEENANRGAEKSVQKGSCTQKDESLQKTIFISNLPFDINSDELKTRFSVFGKIKSVHRVLHQLTKRPKGTAFIEYETIEGAEASILAAETRQGLADSGITIKGRPLTILKAIDKTSAGQKAKEKVEKEVHDHRNLYLTKEGLILEGTPAAAGVSKEDMSKRQILARQKEIKLRSPNFHVSRTRLAIYNVPKSMTEKELKKLFINAVQSRASKQNPLIKQVKILRDIKKPISTVKGRSRGVAFIEFGEHEHAIVALRVLNNHPEKFVPEHRPIVEFAIEDVRKLQKRNLSVASAKIRNGDKGVSAKKQRQNITQTSGSLGDKESFSKTLEGEVKENAVKRNKKERKKSQNETETDVRVGNKSESSKSSKEEEKKNVVKQSKKDRKNRRKVGRENLMMEDNGESNTSGSSKKQKQKAVSGKVPAEAKEKEHMTDKSTGQRQSQDGKGVQLCVSVTGKKISKLQQNVHDKKLVKRKFNDSIDAVSDKQNGKRPKKKANSGKEIEDELDKLVARYRSKLFSNNSNSNKKNDLKQGTGELRRWFE
ncbi:uncharacterized protein LOC131066909 isoform X1 [Cryptomeria japonica]|uniref:uncharacterized protein LOC131066909 isoform X1 n=1 Tax=Cryptomeria japonica TaxID=3369 RepID=UPI0025ACEB49|nr:uncharacterized protein LOC131066909 isoform X1 [Cryptomeria japonica]